MDKQIKEQVAKEFNLKQSQIEKIHDSWWREVRKLLESFDFYENPDATLTDVNIPFLGKFILNKSKTKYINGRIEAKRNTAAVKPVADNGK